METKAVIAQNPNEEERRRIMEFVMAAGKIMLENGAEVFRVEQTMQYMADGFHLREFRVYVITNGIFASAGTAEHADLRNVPSRTVHLGRVAAVNALSREIVAGKLTLSEAEIALLEASKLPEPTLKMQVLASAFGAFSFCILFNGNLFDALVSLLVGGILGWYLCVCERRKVGGLFRRLSGAAMVSLLCMLFGAIFTSLHTSASIIGALMILTPGVAFTMAIRDCVRSDYLSSAIRMMDAILIAASIACGAGLMLWIENIVRGVFQ